MRIIVVEVERRFLHERSTREESNAIQIIETYPSRLPALAQYCSESEDFKIFFSKPSPEAIIQKLHVPILRLNRYNGMLTYTEHELDAIHIIDVEFDGVMERFGNISIDG